MPLSPLAPPVTIIACALLPLYLKEQPPQMAQAWHAAWSKPLDAGLQASLQQIRQAQVSQRQHFAPDSPCTPHEWAYAQAMGWPPSADLLPFAAACAARQGLTCPATQGWAFIDAVHWEINQGQVQLRAVGEVSPEEDQTMLQAMRPYFEEDGITLHAWSPGRWLAHASHFKQLPSVSLDRVLGQDVAYWLDPDSVAAQSPAQRLLRRLQNEMQMLLYTHALNDHRAVPINSFWWSGTGDLPTSEPAHAVLLNTDLQTAFATQDAARWAATWQQLAQDLMAPALQTGQRLVLCGEDRCIGLQAPSHGLWQRLKMRLSQPALHEVLA